jgi:hydroxymethylpyrimidine/phosphomethylpyrimidine kinase
LADCKTFEQHEVYGLAINTANTIRNNFYEIEWTSLNSLRSIKLLIPIKLRRLKLDCSFAILFRNHCYTFKQLSPTTQIVWDTVVKSTTFDFLEIKTYESLQLILSEIDLITQLQ